MIPEIRISDFNYDLPDDRIAKYPLEQRDASKLLEYKGGNLTEHTFRDIPSLIPGNAVMVFNDTITRLYDRGEGKGIIVESECPVYDGAGRLICNNISRAPLTAFAVKATIFGDRLETE